MPVIIEKRYLGDAVYADFDARGLIKLTTENGEHVTNTIFLEPHVMLELQQYFEDAVEATLAARVAAEQA
jgi:hypothetical protein